MGEEKSGLSRRAMMTATAGTLAGLAAATARAQESEAVAPTGPTTASIAEAERLAGVSFTEAEREQMLTDVAGRLAQLEALRAVEKPNTLAPATVFDPRLPGVDYSLPENALDGVHALDDTMPDLPSSEVDVAYAPVTRLAKWIGIGAISSRELTEIYLDRIADHAPELECMVTVLADRARAEADEMDRERAAGKLRGPLHGIPYLVKDLFDAEGGPTTWGAEPWKERTGAGDSAVVRKLKKAGCVLLGKSTLGALAYGDIWFRGVTRNPFNPLEGSSGSSAGSASATAAGLCAFSIGTETLGSLVSPSNRCGTTALRPTFGRISRAGGMALCWSLDKVGPITRSVEDTAIVTAALNGYDASDPSSIGAPFSYDRRTDLKDLRLGYDPAWFEAGNDIDRTALEASKSLGAKEVEFRLPDLPYGVLVQQLLAEAAAAFEEMTLSDQDDLLKWQEDAAWPNSFRATRFLTAIDLIQIDRLRRLAMQELHGAFEGVDMVIGPNFASGLLTPTNFTGHPCLAMRAGFFESQPRTIFGAVDDPDAPVSRVPQAICLWAPLFREGPMIAFGRALERELAVADERPAAFS